MNAQRTRSILIFLWSAAAPLSVFAAPPIDNATVEKAEGPHSPLIVRIDESVLQPLQSQEINHVGRVDRVILGTRAIGDSHTTGKIDVDQVPGRDDGAFTVKFTGHTTSRTVGYNGPARIY